MSEIKVNKISPRTACGTTTLGDSGDTFTIPAGVSITNSGTASGFGSTGEVSWNTTVKTSTFTVTAGEGFFCNTTGGAFTANLPAGTAGNSFAISDYAATFQTNNLTISPNGSQKIGGVNADVVLSTEGQAVYFVYIDDTQGWINVIDSTSNERGNSFVAATGGTITTCGNFKVHTFTGPGTFTVTNAGTPTGSTKVDYVVVAGGGGGGGGGGGAGGFRLSNSVGCIPAPVMSPLVAPNSPSPAALPVSVQGYPITVGGGGTAGGQAGPTAGGNGNPSIFSTITSTAGGGGGSPNGGCASTGGGRPGGSGGGNGHDSAPRALATGNTPPVAPPQGQNGGITTTDSYGAGAGGGGAGAVGINQQSPNNVAGGGGVGSFVSPIFAGSNGTPGPAPSVKYFAGGGGGGNNTGTGTGFSNPAGGSGGGGPGGKSNPSFEGPSTGTAGTANTGGGGGGGAHAPSAVGGLGGSGIVIIRYKFQ